MLEILQFVAAVILFVSLVITCLVLVLIVPPPWRRRHPGHRPRRHPGGPHR
ncbi:hypothetical protein H7X46_24900 [Pseudonocardia sp. C8]|uniref:hypothetical protein n=1 Tax=Pseudonocardia sp. C8 TaxID=2762759 RepID=UPI0016424B44|nr:hypothetical protein [Pseudonocardia sp. C8]MBC3194295.1 hypothetical protein [Pseudonocardia sp. C8]